jgi:hypothetical protein
MANKAETSTSWGAEALKFGTALLLAAFAIDILIDS